MTRMLEWLGALPSTNTRIVVTLVCVLATCGRVVVADAWHPDGAWLAFLAAMAGLDVAQFAAKRATFAPGKTAAATATASPVGLPLEAVAGAGARPATD